MDFHATNLNIDLRQIIFLLILIEYFIKGKCNMMKITLFREIDIIDY